jgi:hypothetical protein
MPEFHSRESEHQAWKAKVLNREIQLDEIDTQPFKDRYGAKFAPTVAVTPKAASG